MPHTDGPLYHPYVSILSLGSPILFKFYSDIEAFYSDDPNEVLLVENGSLFIFEKDFYHKRLHAINEIALESFAVELKIEKGLEGNWTAEAHSSKILNFKNSSLYKNIIQPKLKELDKSSTKDQLIEELMKSLNCKKISCFTFDITSMKKPGENEETMMLIVSWTRELRVSLTVRFVKPAEA